METCKLSKEEIRDYAKLIKDYNPIHNFEDTNFPIAQAFSVIGRSACQLYSKLSEFTDKKQLISKLHNYQLDFNSVLIPDEEMKIEPEKDGLIEIRSENLNDILNTIKFIETQNVAPAKHSYGKVTVPFSLTELSQIKKIIDPTEQIPLQDVYVVVLPSLSTQALFKFWEHIEELNKINFETQGIMYTSQKIHIHNSTIGYLTLNNQKKEDLYCKIIHLEEKKKEGREERRKEKRINVGLQLYNGRQHKLVDVYSSLVIRERKVIEKLLKMKYNKIERNNNKLNLTVL